MKKIKSTKKSKEKKKKQRAELIAEIKWEQTDERINKTKGRSERKYRFVIIVIGCRCVASEFMLLALFIDPANRLSSPSGSDQSAAQFYLTAVSFLFYFRFDYFIPRSLILTPSLDSIQSHRDQSFRSTRRNLDR